MLSIGQSRMRLAVFFGTGALILIFMARLTSDILPLALRAHFVRPKSPYAILLLRFTSDEYHPARTLAIYSRACSLTC